MGEAGKTEVSKTFRPILAATCKSLEKVRFPVLVSPKLDGFRAIVRGGKLLSRTLKPIPNRFTQARFAGLPDGLDGELIVGEPGGIDAWNRTSTGVSSVDGEPEDVRFWIFDDWSQPGGFRDRFKAVENQRYLMAGTVAKHRFIDVVPHELVETHERLMDLEETWVGAGYEGVMVRSLTGPYKHGRSTEIEGFLMKIKRFEDSEAVVVGFEEQMRNDNPKTINALGLSERATKKENKVPSGQLGAFVLEWSNPHHGGKVRFSCGVGLTNAQAIDFWTRRDELDGALVKFKFQGLTPDGLPRFPVYQGLRSTIDVDDASSTLDPARE
jgi:DNA ligase 1